MLVIQNHKKLLGTKLITKDLVEWQVVSIQGHLNHYIIFLETEDGWEKKITLHREHKRFQKGRYEMNTGYQSIEVSLYSLQDIQRFILDLEVLISNN